jgi:hypothetical protein
MEDKGAIILKSEGMRAYARLRLASIAHEQGAHQVNDFMPAEWHICAGEPKQALELARLSAIGDPYTLHLGVDPLYDSIRHNPTFTATLTKAGTPLPNTLVNGNAHLCE